MDRNINLENVKSLLEQGATADHWTTEYEHNHDLRRSRCNVIGLILEAKTETERTVLELCVKKFPSYRRNETTKESLLGECFRRNWHDSWKTLIQAKETETALLAFLRWSGAEAVTTGRTKMKQLKLIAEHNNFGQQIQVAFGQIKKLNLFLSDQVPTNIPVLMQFCESNNKLDILERVFGKSNKINDTVTWRYKRNTKMVWMSESFINAKITGNVRITKNRNKIQVVTLLCCVY